MPKIEIQATSTKFYTVIIEAQDEEEAIELVRDWHSDDFEPYETNAKWDWEATEL
jgi:hypothetical protein